MADHPGQEIIVGGLNHLAPLLEFTQLNKNNRNALNVRRNFVVWLLVEWYGSPFIISSQLSRALEIGVS